MGAANGQEVGRALAPGALGSECGDQRLDRAATGGESGGHLVTCVAGVDDDAARRKRKTLEVTPPSCRRELWGREDLKSIGAKIMMVQNGGREMRQIEDRSRRALPIWSVADHDGRL